MQLPGSAGALVERDKIIHYLRSQDHADGSSKARFFTARGFRPESWETLADALRTHGANNTVVQVENTWHGTKYTVVGVLNTPDGRDLTVRTVWIIETGETRPRLVTAYPSVRQK